METFLSFCYVIGDTPEPDSLPVGVVDDVAGAGVAIAGLADTPDVHQVAGTAVEYDWCFAGNRVSSQSPPRLQAHVCVR